MKQITKALATVAAMLVMAACGGSASSPAKVVEKCWKQLSKGNISKALEMINMAEGEEQTYAQMYADVCRSLEVAGGVDKFEVVSSLVGEAEATVGATVTLHSGQQITQTYTLVKVGKEWKLNQ